MDTRLIELMNILQREEEVFREYLVLVARQHQNIMKENLPDIEDSIDKIHQLAREASELEYGRGKVMTGLVGDLDIRTDDAAVCRILEKFDAPKFEELNLLKNKIIALHNKISLQIERNEFLINQSINVINQAMQFMDENDLCRFTQDSKTGRVLC